MELKPGSVLVIFPAEDLESLKKGQEQILDQIQKISTGQPKPATGYALSHITAKEFMDAVHIRRWKFDQLIATNQIRSVKKKRKIYVPVGEVERFFSDPGVR